MSDDQDDSQKTEDPSDKKLSKAKKEGNVATSREIYNWFMLSSATALFAFMGLKIARKIKNTIYRFVEHPDDILLTHESFGLLAKEVLSDFVLFLIIPFGVMYVTAILAGYVQNGFILSMKSIEPKLEKVSPLSGLKRLFSMKTLFEFLKNLAKMVVIILIVGTMMYPEIQNISAMISMEAGEVGYKLYDVVRRILLMIVIFLTTIAAADWFYQRYAYHKRMRMTKQEVKDEYKQAEGDPQIKGKLRQLRMQKAQQRMMQEVPKADVVITNPTHYAIALRYDMAEMASPTLVAKGADLVAKKIRELAIENDIPIVENPPLARALFDNVELNEEVPEAHYKAVAEVISYVFGLKKKRF
ncbi:MAG: flagellar biosynthesis protein FlhB [Alphaproteobacteria bacterium]